MTDSILKSEIDRMMESLDGELTSHSRVIDGRCEIDRGDRRITQKHPWPLGCRHGMVEDATHHVSADER
jgi:hypothetical protein